MSGKSVMEMVWGTLLALCIAFIGGLVLLCIWGMYSRDFLKFLCFAVIVIILGLPLLEISAGALESAGKTRIRRKSTTKRNSEMDMHFESNTYYNNADGKTITVQVIPDEEFEKLKQENATLKQRIRLSELTLQDTQRQLLIAKRNHQEECKQYGRVLDATRAKIRAVQDEYREQREIDHLEHMELRAWRKTEKARKKREDRLRARVKKIRQKAKVDAVIVAAKDYAVADKTARECNIHEHRLEISNAIIALAEYVKPNNPTEEFMVYLWDCRTVQALIEDIHESIVSTAFGPKWEGLLLAGMIGLRIIKPPCLKSILSKSS